MAPRPDLVTHYIALFRHRLGAMTDGASKAINHVWDQLPGYDEAHIAQFAAAAMPMLDAFQSASIHLAAGFYSTLAEVPPPSIRPASLGVEFDSRAPFTAHWHALAGGAAWAQALGSGRAASSAATDRFLISSTRRTGGAVVRSAGLEVDRWTRVPSPTSCEWCRSVAADDYSSADTADFGHDHCSCTAVPVLG